MTNVYVGVYIEINPMSQNIITETTGCKSCNTTFFDNFCKKCGSPKTKWSIETKNNISRGDEIFEYIMRQLDKTSGMTDDEYQNIYDSLCGLEFGPVIISEKTYYCDFLEYYGSRRKVIDIKEISTKLKQFKANNKEFIDCLRKCGFEFEIVYGVVTLRDS